MVSIYGAEAGNLALKYLATGGVYIGGGIAAQILPKLRDGTFIRSFAAKGRFAELLDQIPVQVILNDETALPGAAHHARAAERTRSLETGGPETKFVARHHRMSCLSGPAGAPYCLEQSHLLYAAPAGLYACVICLATGYAIVESPDPIGAEHRH